MPQQIIDKQRFNIKGKETLALIFLNLIVILGLAVFYVVVLRNKIPDNVNDVLGTSNCQGYLISGNVYKDKNSNGVKDSGEEGISQVSVIVKMQNGQEFVVNNPGSGDSNNSNDGVYEVCAPKNQWARVMFKNFSPYYPGPRGSDSKTSVSFVYTSSNQKVSLGLISSDTPNVIEIGNRIWEDENQNGLQDPGERGIPNVTVKLLEFNSKKTIATTKTDSEGLFYFNSRSNSELKPEATYLIVVEASEFAKGNILEGTKTTKYRQGNDGYIDSDASADKESVEIPVVIGVGGCNQCLHNFDFGVVRVRAVGSVTPTPYTEPNLPPCPNNMQPIALNPAGDTLSVLFRDRDPRSLTHSFNLTSQSNIYIVGLVKEGHPEAGCPSSDPNSQCNQGQRFESFKYELDGSEFGRYEDRGAEFNGWTNVGPWNFSSLSAGTHELKFSHLLQGTTAESVDYKFAVCASTLTNTPTNTPTIAPTQTSTPAVTFVPTGSPTNTPISTASPTSTPTDTPQVSGTSTTSSPTPTGSPFTTQQVSPTSSNNPTSTATSSHVLSGSSQNLPNTGIGEGLLIILGIGSLAIGSLSYFGYKKRFKIRLKKISQE